MRGKKIPPSFFQDSVWKSQELPAAVFPVRTVLGEFLAEGFVLFGPEQRGR